jgi:Flp pilus assembly protein TadD
VTITRRSSKALAICAALFAALAMGSLFPNRAAAQCSDCNDDGGGGYEQPQYNPPKYETPQYEVPRYEGPQNQGQEYVRPKYKKKYKKAKPKHRAKPKIDREKQRRDAAEADRKRRAAKAKAAKARERARAKAAERDRLRRQKDQAAKKAKEKAAKKKENAAAPGTDELGTASNGPVCEGQACEAGEIFDSDCFCVAGPATHQTTLDGKEPVTIVTQTDELPYPGDLPTGTTTIKIGPTTIYGTGWLPKRKSCKGRTAEGCYLRAVKVPRLEGGPIEDCMTFCPDPLPPRTRRPPKTVKTDPAPAPPKDIAVDETPGTPAVKTPTATPVVERQLPPTPAVNTPTAKPVVEPPPRRVVLGLPVLKGLEAPPLVPGVPVERPDHYCYKGSYGRGVGTIPTACRGGKENDVGLCYKKCKEGYYGVSPVCWQRCPKGYINTGALCHIDKALLTTGWFKKCGIFNLPLCNQCPKDYTNIGLLCTLNTPPVPPGWKGLTGLDIIKDSYGRGVGTIPTACKGGKEYHHLLCYKSCKRGYSGFGPVCWNTCPKGYVECGAGCATSSTHCATVTADQTLSTLGLVANVLTAGASGSVTAVANVAKNAGKVRQLWNKAKQATKAMKNSKAFKKAKDTWDSTKNTRDTVKAGLHVRRVERLASASTEEEAARILAGFDPSGVSQVVQAFAQDICNEYVPPQSPQPQQSKAPDLVAATSPSSLSGYRDCGQSHGTDQTIAGCTTFIHLAKKNDRWNDTSEGSGNWAHKQRAYARNSKGDHDGAIADYTEAIALDPKDHSAYSNRAAIHEKKFDTDSAIADYTKAIELFSKVFPAGAPGYHWARGKAYSENGDYERAIADYDKAIAQAPSQPHFYNGRGVAHQLKGDLDRAIADYDKALALDPKDTKAAANRQLAVDKKRAQQLATAGANNAAAPAAATATLTPATASGTTPSGTSAPSSATSTQPSGTPGTSTASSTTPSGTSAPSSATGTPPSGTSGTSTATGTQPSGTSGTSTASSTPPSGTSGTSTASGTTPSGTSAPSSATGTPPSGTSGTSTASGTPPSGAPGTSTASSTTPSGTSGPSSASGTTPSGTSAPSSATGTQPSGTSGTSTASGTPPSGTSGTSTATGTQPSGTSGTSTASGTPPSGTSGTSTATGTQPSGTSGTSTAAGTTPSGTSGTSTASGTPPSGTSGTSTASGTTPSGTSGTSTATGTQPSGTSGTSVAAGKPSAGAPSTATPTGLAPPLTIGFQATPHTAQVTIAIQTTRAGGSGGQGAPVSAATSTSPSAGTMQPSAICSYYRGKAPRGANVAAKPGFGTSYINVIKNGQIVCVTRLDDVYGEDYVHISHTVGKPMGRTPIDGWVLLSDMELVTEDASVRREDSAPTTAPVDLTKFPVETLSCSQLRPTLDRDAIDKGARQDTAMYDYLVWVAGYSSKKDAAGIVFDGQVLSAGVSEILEQCIKQPDAAVTTVAAKIFADNATEHGDTAMALADVKCEAIGEKAVIAAKIERTTVRQLWMWLAGYYAAQGDDTVFDLKSLNKNVAASDTYCAKHRDASLADVAEKFDAVAN